MTGSGYLRWLYAAAGVLVVFTGFGNMPLWKRYYIADIPGLAWSGNFMVNVQVHMITGAILIGLALYFAATYFQQRESGLRLTRTGGLRAVLLALALLSGIVMAVKNLAAVRLPVEMLVAANLFHMTAGMLFLAVSVGCLVARCRWTD